MIDSSDARHWALHGMLHLLLKNVFADGDVKCKKVKQYAYNYTARKWQNQDPNGAPRLLAPRTTQSGQAKCQRQLNSKLIGLK